jgi:hypothetical protein
MNNSRTWASATSLVAALACAAQADAATLSGAVTANGRPIDSAVVSIYVAAPGARKFVTITNASGAYRFTNVLNGLHIVIVEKDGRRIYQGSTNVQATDARFDVKL